ncbi:MAG: hypothetical protein WDO19_09870 [Bacteroidota bacterium]
MGLSRVLSVLSFIFFQTGKCIKGPFFYRHKRVDIEKKPCCFSIYHIHYTYCRYNHCVSAIELYAQPGLGFSKEQTVVINTNFDKNKDVFKQSLSSIPGVVSSTFSSHVPGGGSNSAYSEVENKRGEMQKSNLDLYFVDFDYINQYNLKLAAGRSFSKDFPTDSTQAMVINESAAKMLGYSSPQEAIGRKFDQWKEKARSSAC